MRTSRLQSNCQSSVRHNRANMPVPLFDCGEMRPEGSLIDCVDCCTHALRRSTGDIVEAESDCSHGHQQRVNHLAMHDIITHYFFRRVERVDNEARFSDDLCAVVAGMIRNDEYAIVVFGLLYGSGLHSQVVFAPITNERDVRIVVGYFRNFVLQQLDDGQRGRLSQIIDIFVYMLLL